MSARVSLGIVQSAAGKKGDQQYIGQLGSERDAGAASMCCDGERQNGWEGEGCEYSDARDKERKSIKHQEIPSERREHNGHMSS